ncbi:MAG: glutamate synthase subunit beta, partial [Solirubrobacteraceae bacterium]
LGISEPPVSIKAIECAIVEHAFEQGWIKPEPPAARSGKRAAVIGSGPAGLAAAQQLRRAGHRVVLFERDEAAGGLVRFGVPDFKIEKRLVERRVEQLVAEGVELRLGVDVGGDIDAQELRERFDAIVLAIGSRVPRDLEVEGRELPGTHFAMEYLYARNRWATTQFGPQPGAAVPAVTPISAAERRVVVIGGGDTGADCVGQAIREGARSIVQLELVPEPPERRPDERTPWPRWPNKFRLSYAMKEAQSAGRGELDYSIVTTRITGERRVEALHVAEAEPAPPFGPLAGTEQVIDADLVLLAMGFLHPEHDGVLAQLGAELDARGNVDAPQYETSLDGVFVAGDARRGQSLIVWAINEGRQCARRVERYLAMKAS